MNEWLLPIGIGVILGLIAGVFAVRASQQKERIHGGTPAKVFHYLGASLFIAAVPSGLIELLTGRGVGNAVLASFTLVILSLIALFIYALFERPALDKQKPSDEGWTAEKARTSGL